ncbi:MAG: hypothetical protein IPL52_17835 [Flavobacteriales bacterium]|nr:hypothetical protein [Flavobacteriales bacterium]
MVVLPGQFGVAAAPVGALLFVHWPYTITALMPMTNRKMFRAVHMADSTGESR